MLKLSVVKPFHLISTLRLLLALLTGVLGVYAPVAKASPADPKVRVFQIESLDQQTRCSATLIPSFDSEFNPVCRLVTNAHCVASASSRFLLSSPPGAVSSSVRSFFGNLHTAAVVSVQSIARGADLAELSVPPSLQTLDCGPAGLESDLEVEQRVVSKRPVSSSERPSGAPINAYYAALGFHGGKAVATFAEDGDWGRGVFVPSTLYRARTSLPSLQSVYNFTNLPLANGMSGGATIDHEGHVVGINVRLVQLQDESFVIPLSDVLRFLEAREVVSTPSPNVDKKSVAAGENVGGHAGENVGGHAGENVGGHAGENVGGHAGDKKSAPTKSAPKKKTRLSSFSEPEEGVDVEVNGQTRTLLAVGANQIDGADDLRAYKDNPAPRLFRDSNEFAKARHKIFTRFAGDYRPAEAVVPDVMFQWNSEIQTWSPATKGRAGAWVVVKPKGDDNAEILFSYFNSSESGIRTIYKAAFSKDGRMISLVNGSDGSILTCENENFLKLICSSDVEELSFSLAEISGRDLTIRSARLQRDGRVRYVYGTLQRVSK